MEPTGAASAAPMEAAIAANIRAALTAHKMNKTQLANITGISYPTIRFRLEAGNGLKFAELIRIAGALRMAPNALLPRELVS